METFVWYLGAFVIVSGIVVILFWTTSKFLKDTLGDDPWQQK